MAQVPAASYGLNILEVLRAPEKDLNQVVGMKKLAPYREDGGLVRPNYSKLRLMQVPPCPPRAFPGLPPCTGLRSMRLVCRGTLPLGWKSG